MQQIEVMKRTVGVNFSEGRADINIWAPLAKKVTVVTGNAEFPLEKRHLVQDTGR
jgi:hypothetical protein